MAYRSSISGAAALALLAGCFGVVCPAARAGDIIEFSSPTAILDVPQQEREVKEESRPSTGGNFQGPDAAVPMFIPAPTVIIPSQNRNGFGWRSPFQDDENANDGSGLDLFAPTSGPSRTNRWEGLRKDSKNQNLTEFGAEDSPFHADAPQRDGLFGRDEFGSRPSERDAWSLDVHGPTADERMHEGEFIPENEKFTDAFGQQGGVQTGPGAFGQPDPLHASTFSPGSPGISQDDSTPGPGMQGFSPPAIRAWEAPTTVRPRRSRAEEDAIAAQRRSPSAPAQLPWPKMPGSLSPN